MMQENTHKTLTLYSMGRVSIEIKARCPDPVHVRKILKFRGARFKGLDHQSDTYFRIPAGRLKLREGNIENALIYYRRANWKNSKKCDTLYANGLLMMFFRLKN